MPVRTKQLKSGRSGTANFANTYVCPTLETTIIKSVLIGWRVATAGTVNIQFVTTGGTTTVLTKSMANGETWDLEGLFWVLMPTHEIRVVASVTDGCWYMISGAQLEGIAD